MGYTDLFGLVRKGAFYTANFIGQIFSKTEDCDEAADKYENITINGSSVTIYN